MEYIAFMHDNVETKPTDAQWSAFISMARKSGLFQGGSAIGKRTTVGEKPVPDVTEHIGGYMRFEAERFDQLTALLEHHPVLVNGGTIEICELPKT